MMVIPALDLRAGRVVRLGAQGDFGSESAFGDPVRRAAEFVSKGARRLHVVDLDAVAGTGDNRSAVQAVISATGAEVEVSGGVRSAADAEAWLVAGAHAVTMGTTAVLHPEVLAEAAARHPGRLLAALDLRGGRPAVSGWTAVADRDLDDLLARWDAAALGGLVLTSVDRDGSLEGPDLEALARVRSGVGHPVYYSGGIAGLEDLDRLREAGAAGAIVGRALLEGRFTLESAVARCAG